MHKIKKAVQKSAIAEERGTDMNIIIGFAFGAIAAAIFGCYTGAIMAILILISKDIVMMFLKKLNFSSTAHEFAGAMIGIILMTTIMIKFEGETFVSEAVDYRLTVDYDSGIHLTPEMEEGE
jgi:predicted acylesterase/phospholipase RssA